MSVRATTIRAKLVLQSGNRKTGPIPVSITSANSCPPSCGVKNECYAKFHHLALHWERVNVAGVLWEEFCAQVANLPMGMVWRHNEAGDLPGVGACIDTDALALLVAANAGRKGFTYTHKPVLGAGKTAARNRCAIAQANAAGFVINLSADTIAEADAKAALNIGPVTVLVPEDVAEKRMVTPQGRPVVICPHHFDRRVQCWFCGLCADGSRIDIVGFPAHGSRRRQISERLKVLES